MEATSWRRARGSSRRSQDSACASPIGWEQTVVTPSRDGSLEIRFCEMERYTSPQIFSGLFMSSSRVCVTVPSIEFSTGTTPCSASPRSTRVKTSATVDCGNSSTLAPNERSAASWVKVASGPK